MRKFFALLVIFFTCAGLPAEGLSNSSEAFLSLKFGLKFARVQKRMEKSGSRVLTPRKESLTMEGFFEGYPALFVFGFYKGKILNSKAVYLQSMGDAEYDQKFYDALQRGFVSSYGSTKQTPSANTRNAGKILLNNVWTPDRYTTITLIYNPEVSKRFPGSSLNDRFIQISYKYSKWE